MPPIPLLYALPFLTQGPFPQSPLVSAQVLFVVLAQAWGCRAKAWRTEGRPHVTFVPSSAVICWFLMLIKQYVLPPQTDPQPPFLPPSPCFLLLHESSLVLAICSDYPFPLLLGTGRKGRDAAMFPALQDMNSFLSLC